MTSLANPSLGLLLIVQSQDKTKYWNVHHQIFRGFSNTINNLLTDFQTKEVLIEVNSDQEFEMMNYLINLVYQKKSRFLLPTEFGWRKFIILLHLASKWDFNFFKIKSRFRCCLSLVFEFMEYYPVSAKYLKRFFNKIGYNSFVGPNLILINLATSTGDLKLIRLALDKGLSFKVHHSKVQFRKIFSVYRGKIGINRAMSDLDNWVNFDGQLIKVIKTLMDKTYITKDIGVFLLLQCLDRLLDEKIYKWSDLFDWDVWIAWVTTN